jgi:hypothetical protein
VRAPRKQVLVVVTAGWRVLAFDHNLALLWEGDVEGAAGRARARPHEVAIAVTPHRVRASDRGLVVVGGDVGVGSLAEQAAGTHEAAAAGAGRAGGVLEGVLQDEIKWEAGGGGGGGGTAEGGKGGGLGAAAGTTLGAGADASRHFDYYAFEGGGGEARWSHTAGSFRGGELEAAAEELAPQHSFKLDAEKLAGRHYGELSCRDFRESVLHALPHYWGRPEDTRLEEAHFVRHREGTGAQKRELARAGAARAAAAGARGPGPEGWGDGPGRGLLGPGGGVPSTARGAWLLPVWPAGPRALEMWLLLGCLFPPYHGQGQPFPARVHRRRPLCTLPASPSPPPHPRQAAAPPPSARAGWVAVSAARRPRATRHIRRALRRATPTWCTIRPPTRW